MSYLKIALQAMKAATLDGEVGAPEPELVGQAPTHTPPAESPQATSEERSGTCESCPWFELNPWTHYPDFGAWCHRQMVHLMEGSAVCEEFRRGEVHPRQRHKQVPAVPANTFPVPQERILTCADCHNFEPNNGSNPRQGWGKCLKRGRGRFGCATACAEAFSQEEASHAYPQH